MVLLALIAYQVFTGVVFQKIGDGADFHVQYLYDGTFSGSRIDVGDPIGEEISGMKLSSFSGEWDFTPLNDGQFRLTVKLKSGGPASGAPAEGGNGLLALHPLEGTFGILDHDHIHNMDGGPTWDRVPQ